MIEKKGEASLTLGQVIDETRNNFPIERYRPQTHARVANYRLFGIDPSPHQIWVTADGIGTKPELAERLSDNNNQDPSYFEGLAFDTLAMIDGDEARFGRIMLGAANVIDVNTATPAVIEALARGAKTACDKGSFALLNGETAELGYRVSGYGRTRVNWNAFGVSLVLPNKLITGERLAPGQPVVALRETSIRSNGLSKARNIMEAAYLNQQGYTSKADYFMGELANFVAGKLETRVDIEDLDTADTLAFMHHMMGHDVLEQVLVSWQDYDERIVEEILKPSTLYGHLINSLRGWVDYPPQVEIVAAAHITGGGIPEKAKRMLMDKGLGAHIDTVFPDPTGVTMLMDLAQKLPDSEKILTDKGACEQWNRGIGFMVVTPDEAQARYAITTASAMGFEAAIAGHILEESKIEWRGHTWDLDK